MQILSNLLFSQNVGIWFKLGFRTIKNLTTILKLPLSESTFNYLFKEQKFKNPTNYYLIWKYNRKYFHDLDFKIDTHYLLEYDGDENPFNSINYLKEIRGHCGNQPIKEYEVEKLLHRLSENNSSIEVWNFYLSQIQKLPQWIKILYLGSLEIKDLLIQEYLKYYNKDSLYQNFAKSIISGNYTIETQYIRGYINVNDCIMLYRKYFTSESIQKEYFTGTDKNSLKNSYGELIYQTLKNKI